MQGTRGGPHSAADAKAPRRALDVNKERLIFCLTSIIGHRVTAKLRGNVIYEGLFHSCALEGDYSITLKHARCLASEHDKSGSLIETLVIPGKDFLQVNAIDVQSPEILSEEGALEGAAFATDAEITAKGGGAPGEDRHLVPWAGEDDAVDSGGIQDGGAKGTWSADAMFKVNEQQYGITSTFNEDFYTTKLDQNSIPREKREEAERIAKAIEGGVSHADVEERVGEEDEEGCFSAVTGTGAYAAGASSLTGSSGAAPSKATPKADAGAAEAAGDAQRDYRNALPPTDRKQRGMIIAHAPAANSSMISEMKRINALNLEPAVPKLDDKTGNDWINFKASQTRNKANPAQGDGLKAEFQEALSVIQKRGDQKQQQQRQQEGQSERSLVATPSAGEGAGGSKSFSFNPNAKDFTFNPTAASFTPTAADSTANAAVPKASSSAAAAKSPAGPSPQFNAAAANTGRLAQSLEGILDGFAERMRGDISNQDTGWLEATGPACREALGQPNPSMPTHIGQLQGGGGCMAPQWQQQSGMGQPGQPGQQGPQMMMQPQGQAPGQAAGAQQMMGAQQGGFMGGGQPFNPAGGQPAQMFQPMYPAPAGTAQMRPPAGGGQGQQQPMGFNQQNQQMPMQQQQQQQQQQMAMQGNMAQPKFGNMPNMPQGMQQGMPQGMVMMMPQGGPGMPQGGFAPMGQPGQGNQQMMPRPMYQGQMPGGQMSGGPPPMPGHEG